MQNSYDENKPLYGSRGIEIYLTLIRQKYSDLNIDELLRYAEMETYQVKDEGHFFSQRQINRFYEKLVELSGNKKIAREAGRFSASPESFSAVQRSLLGLISPVKFYELMGKYVNNITKSAKYEARVLASNKVEIVVTLNPGIKEEPFQCENRMGYWEATATMFKLKPPKIEHPECLFKEGKVCRYIVTWPKSPVTILTIIRNIGLVLLGLSCFVFPGLYYYLHPTQSSLMIFSTLYALAATLLLTTNWFLNKFEKKNLMETIDLLRNSSDQLIEQVDINYENSLLINEIGNILAKHTEIQGLFTEIIKVLHKRLDYDRILVMLTNSKKNRLNFQAGDGYNKDQNRILHKLSFHLDNPDSKGIFYVCFRDQKPILINDIDEIKDELSTRSYEFAQDMGVKSLICCPIIYEDESLGILAVDNIVSKRPLVQRDINLLMGIALQLGSRLHNITLESHLRQIQKMEAVGNLAGGVAHDFNNILTTILGYFSRKQVMEMQVSNLNLIVEDMTKMLGRLIGEDISLKTYLSSSISNIMVDSSQIGQILMNLVVNARDAMPQGGSITIETSDIYIDQKYAQGQSGLKAGNYSMLSVTDTGQGMGPELREKIFEPFFTTKSPGKGTGLGLSTVYGIVKQHNSYIYVYSEPGHGTTFKVYFPIVEGDIEPKLVKESQPLTGGEETILVVDDDKSILRLIMDTLQPLGYNVISASSGMEALEKCEKSDKKIDLVLSDVIMPGMNGRELVKVMQDQCPHVKAVLMSGYTDNVIAQQGVDGSNYILINKPLLPISLANKIREVLDNKHEKPQARQKNGVQT
jgi:signal transduction histidine kinase/CheY-like chemotaxis protein